MTYVHVNDFAKEFKTTADWLLEEAEAEFDKGDLVQASGKAWGAAEQCLEAIAKDRDWGYDTYSHLVQVADMLWEETENDDMLRLFSSAEALHTNYYETYRSEASVRRAMDDVKKYVAILAEMLPPDSRRDATVWNPSRFTERATPILNLRRK